MKMEKRLKIVAAFDSFKGSMTAREAGEAFAEGARRGDPSAVVSICPMSDGGEGMVDALTGGESCADALDREDGAEDAASVLAGSEEGTEDMAGDLTGARGGKVRTMIRTVRVTGPSGKPVVARYTILQGTIKTALIEVSAAAGLTLLKDGERNPLHTTTCGVGELIRDAIHQGCRHFLIGLGGTGTNDGGAGMLQALGFQFLDEKEQEISPGAEGLLHLQRIDSFRALPELSDCTFRIACDVTNPLCGPEGASGVFGPQKGADAETVAIMDQALSHYADVVRKRAHFCFVEKQRNGVDDEKSCDKRMGEERFLSDESNDGEIVCRRSESVSISPENDWFDPEFPGAGAAGGLGYAFRAFLHGTLESGIDIVMEETHLEEKIRDADFVVTGEGRLDAQTAKGKVPSGVARLAKKYGKPVVCLAGSVSSSENERLIVGTDKKRRNAEKTPQPYDAVFSILSEPCSLADAMNPENAKRNMSRTAEQVVRLLWLRNKRF